jgi:hypothetical protein
MGSIGNLFKSPNLGPALSGGSLALGEIGNLLAGGQQSQQAKLLRDQQQRIASMSPADLTRMVQSAQAPLNQGLVQSVQNSVQGDLAQRGLAQAPGIFAATESQALAPYVQQNYDRALQQVLTQLGLPMEYATTIKQFLPGQKDITPSMMMFLKQLAARKGGGSSSPSFTADTSWLQPTNSGSEIDFSKLTNGGGL